ncbi:hypothetical protein [Candidatus Villigracilis vicinus]|uniref:hypothetical protein n=1 Tax=Candidatus Villigracilis vicinus TaxID=3140679 RepID=UPI0031E69300
MLAPEKNWWKPMGRMEKSWLTVALVWCIFLTIMMPLWYLYGKQNVPTETYRTSPADYGEKVNAFVEQYTIGTDEATGLRCLLLPPLPGVMCTSAPAPGNGIRFCNLKKERNTACISLPWICSMGSLFNQSISTSR